MNELAPIETSVEPVDVWRPTPMMHPARLAALWEFSDKIAFGTAVPETLRGERKGNEFTPFDDRTVLANVFAVVEQAERWNMSPFALLQGAAIVRGKLAYEGKVIAAVLEEQFGISLHAYYRGEPGTDHYHIYLCDQPLPEDVLGELKPGYRHDRYKIMDGSVAGWKTTGNGSPWRPLTYADMLMYRGVRQWARVYKSRVMMGVVAEDEAYQAALEHAAQNAIPVGQRFAPPSTGFNAGSVAAQLKDQSQVPMEIIKDKVAEHATTDSGEQHGGNALKTTAEPTSSSAKPAENSAGAGAPANGAGSAAADADQPQQNSTAQQADAPAGAVEGGDAGLAPVRVSADIFTSYHQALARFDKKESVEKGHKQFWSGKGVKLVHPDDLKLAKDIYDNHQLRAEGKVTAEQLGKFVADWIKEVAGDPL